MLHWKQRLRASIIHLAMSLAVAALAAFLVFGIFRGDFKKQAIGYTLIVGANLIQPATLLLWAADTGVLDTYLPSILQDGFIICGMFIPLILLRFYNGEKGNGYKWLFYIFSLLIISLVIFKIVSLKKNLKNRKGNFNGK